MVNDRILENSEFIRKMRKALSEGFGKFIICTGLPGTGKSYCALRLLEIVDDNFSTDNIVVGDCLGFVGLLEKALDGEFPNGSAILFDEAGLGLAARDWSRKQNKLMATCFQLIRKQGLLITFTVPNWSQIDINNRRLANYWMSAIALSQKDKRSYFKLWRLHYDEYMNKIFRYNIKEKNRDITRWDFALPQRVDLKEYEKRKDRTIKNLLIEARTVLSNDSDAAKPVGKPPIFKNEIIQFLNDGLTPQEVADNLGCSIQNVYQTKRKMNSISPLLL